MPGKSFAWEIIRLSAKDIRPQSKETKTKFLKDVSAQLRNILETISDDNITFTRQQQNNEL